MKNKVDHPDFWDEIYKNNSAGWDMKSPTPAFIDILKDKKLSLSGKILILGSGYGYDAVEAAKHGLEVTAVDISETAVSFSKQLAENNNVKLNFIVDDFFNLPQKYSGYFDAVYDYVTLCAINPARREEYASMVSEILKCHGKFIALLFPVEDRPGGPPYGLNVDAVSAIFTKYLSLKITTDKINTIKPRRGREVLQIYSKQC